MQEIGVLVKHLNRDISLSVGSRTPEGLQRTRDRHKASSSRPRLWAVVEDEPLMMIRPSTAGYTRFCSEMYLESTEMSMSPAREKSQNRRIQKEAEAVIFAQLQI